MLHDLKKLNWEVKRRLIDKSLKKKIKLWLDIYNKRIEINRENLKLKKTF